jgi:uncharacterized membrane protein YhdT
MPLYTLPNATSGIDDITIQIVSIVPSIIPLFLAFIYFTIWLGGASLQKSRTGSADFPLWSVIGSMVSLMVALIMSTVTGIIQLDYLIINVVIVIFSGVWLFLDKRQSEV